MISEAIYVESLRKGPGWCTRYSWATGWTAEDVVIFPSEARDVSLFQSALTDSGATQPLIQWEPGVKQPGREADHSPPSGAEVKNEFTPHMP